VVDWGGTALVSLRPAEVRSRILLSEHDAYLFGGLLREMIDPFGRSDEAVAAAIHAAVAEDIVAGLSDGLGTHVGAQARTLSGGQRQRLQLARALLAEREILILLEPASAVDSYTEALIAQRVKVARTGRTTVVVSSSPAFLSAADEVAFMDNGRVTALGTHHELLAANPRYRAVIEREPSASTSDSTTDGVEHASG